MAESDGSPGENPPVSTQNVAGGIGEGREDTSDPVASTSGSAPGVGSAGGEHHSQLVNSQLVSVPVVVVPCVVAPVGLTDSSGQFGMTRQAVLATVTAQAQMQLEVGDTQTSNSYQQQISSAHSSTPIRKSSVANLEVNVIPSKLQKPSASNHKALSPHIVVKTTSSDGYNWRKYGQKQVKSSENSRSYFRCTYANCFAKKKVEHCHDGRVVEVIYRGEHNHDPPQKLKYSKECFFEHNGKGKRNLNNQRMEFDASDYYTKQSEKDTCNGASEQLHCSSDCEQDLRVNTEGDNGNELASKPRVFENRTTYLAPVFKTVRKPKMVVQSACELGKINDGYKWRKYGQKIVKGNPNPRSYYKCTNAGCPVRKHVEKASKDARSVIITYEGQHNHDLPTSKQHNETLTRAPATRSPADALYTSVVSTSGKQVQSSNCVLDTESPAGDAPVRDGESMVGTEMDLAGEMALESAETLLSIRCKTTSEDGDKANNPDVIQCPLFDQARPVVPV